MGTIKRAAYHMICILCAAYAVFFAIDKVNPMMAFINNDITKTGLMVLCFAVFTENVFLIIKDRRRAFKKARQQELEASGSKE